MSTELHAKSAKLAGVCDWTHFPWKYVRGERERHAKAEELHAQYHHRHIDGPTYAARLTSLFLDKHMSIEEYQHSLHEVYAKGGIGVTDYLGIRETGRLVESTLIK